jgi:hypothetical protein
VIHGRKGEQMERGGETRPLGAVLVEQGLVTDEDVDGALAIQVQTSQPLGQILVERALVARPLLAKALALQRGVSLEEEGGFGSGLMAKIEQLHLIRRGLDADCGAAETEEAPEPECFETPDHLLEPENAELHLLRKREEELAARERELEKLEERLTRK